MGETRPLSRAAYAYVFSVIAAGLLAIGHSAVVLAVNPVSSEWLALAALTLVTGSVWIKIPSLAARISVSEAFVFAAVLLFGPAAATVIVALDCFVMSMWLKNRRFGIRSLFNFSAVALAIWLSATAFFVVAQVAPGNLEQLLPIKQHLGALLLLASAYFLLNSWFVATAVAFEQHANVFSLWWRNFPWFSLNYFGGISVAALLVPYAPTFDVSVVGIVLPLLLIPYLTYRTSLGRIEDARRHVDQLNELYMSTIEALAMAVDAKDQITHGHIRRVQVYAVELAKRLGVTDERQLKAIATAALLHDMGKLAIPEHILNKPGKLTVAEFDKMKKHADIGADLLSSVKFPYPVVPIVRHHHEHWDGTGYPAQISGTDIPLGARILSIVDCFDALTSDRPYRPRLTADEAFAIIRDRKATMYDPLIVDAFLKAYTDIAPAAISAGNEARSIIDTELIPISPHSTDAPLERIRASVFETALLDECTKDIAKSMSREAAFHVAARYLRQLTPATVYALFDYDNVLDVLSCEAVVGDHQRRIVGLEIKLGERITGWSAANRRTAVNATASLDLAHIAGFFVPPLQSALATPLVQDDRLLGTLTGYATDGSAFKDGHRYAFEFVGAALVARSASFETGLSSNLVTFRSQKH